tara:strand:+ start:1205 stop:1663 length:459 start_codon:yes stop_codon:yes gene_type:complete
MSKELPFFKFYPTEWLLGKISRETKEIQITFLKASCWYWQKDGDITYDDIIFYEDEKLVKVVIEKGYIKLGKSGKISIKFLDEQILEHKKRNKLKKESGRKGGLKSASLRKKKTKEDYIKEAMKHDDPSQRLSKDVAEILINSEIEKGNIVL